MLKVLILHSVIRCELDHLQWVFQDSEQDEVWLGGLCVRYVMYHNKEEEQEG